VRVQGLFNPTLAASTPPGWGNDLRAMTGNPIRLQPEKVTL
jgi:hypothetical protein